MQSCLQLSGTGGKTQTLPLELKDLIASGVPVVTLALLLVSAPTNGLSGSSDCLHTYAEELSDLGQGLRIPRKVGIDSTRRWALVPRHLGQPFHAKVGGWFDRRFH